MRLSPSQAAASAAKQGIAAAQKTGHPVLGDPVVDEGAYAHTYENIGKDAFQCAQHLLSCPEEPLAAGEGRGVRPGAHGGADEGLHLVLHVQALDE